MNRITAVVLILGCTQAVLSTPITRHHSSVYRGGSSSYHSQVIGQHRPTASSFSGAVSRTASYYNRHSVASPAKSYVRSSTFAPRLALGQSRPSLDQFKLRAATNAVTGFQSFKSNRVPVLNSVDKAPAVAVTETRAEPVPVVIQPDVVEVTAADPPAPTQAQELSQPLVDSLPEPDAVLITESSNSVLPDNHFLLPVEVLDSIDPNTLLENLGEPEPVGPPAILEPVPAVPNLPEVEGPPVPKFPARIEDDAIVLSAVPLIPSLPIEDFDV